MIRKCRENDFAVILEIVNDGAQAYRNTIPEDRWREPYMSAEELRGEMGDGVVFWGYEEDGVLTGVMGIQDKGDVTLIRHAYVRTSRRNHGIGGRILRFLESMTAKPILIGTWAAASWAIVFYEKNGFRLLEQEEKDRLLKKYWTIPKRQIQTSVVLANAGWRGM